MTYDGTIVEPGVEIVGFTIVPPEFEELDPIVLFAIRNISTDLHLCSINLRTYYDNDSGAEIANAFGIVDAPPHRGSWGSGGLMSCLSPGHVGMQSAIVQLAGGWTRHDVAAIRWSIGALDVYDAVPTTDLPVTDLRVVTETYNFRFAGRLHNSSSSAVRNPDVAVYGVNAVGRPIAEGSDIELTTIFAGSYWPFETLTFDTDAFSEIVAFPRASEL